MSKLAKGILSAALSLCVASSAMGVVFAEQNAQGEQPAAHPETFSEFILSGWIQFYDYNIKSYEEQVKELSESGMNWLLSPHITSDSTGAPPAPPARYDWERVNNACRENDMYFMMHANSASEGVENAKDLDRCIAYYVKDEPSSAQFPATAQTFSEYRSMDDSRFPFVNLFPNYAGTSNLGGTYEEYVRNFVKSVGSENLEYLYFDHYPFTQAEPVRSTYFSDLEVIRKVAYENDRMKTGGFTQMGGWNGMERPTPEMARWSVYSLLAYGMKSLSHFCWVAPKYVEPPQGEGMGDFVLTNDGKPTDLLEPMQKLNWQIRQMGPLLMSIDAKHAYHTGEIPMGTEALPQNFVLQPRDKDASFIVSLFTSKDDKKTYIMLFNKSLDETVTAGFNLTENSGISGITRLDPDSFDELPAVGSELPALTETKMDISGGVLTDTFEAGEAKIYELSGDVNIPEPLQAPRVSHKSGNYIGQQTIEIESPEKDAQIYYTLNGNYPTTDSTLYTGPITLGEDKVNSVHTIRAMCVKDGEISPATRVDIVIGDASTNVALDKPITLSVEGEPFNCTNSSPGVINDGVNDPWSSYASKASLDTPGWAIIDFGRVEKINRVMVAAWHEWVFEDVIVQLSTTEDFSPGTTYTVYNNDADNSVGQGVGKDEKYQEIPYAGHTFLFDPVDARYMRFYNKCVDTTPENSGRVRSVWTEMQAYSVYEEGEELAGPESEWLKLGGNWNISDDGVITQSSPYDHSSWDRALSYTQKTFKNFILEGTFRFNIDDTNAWGNAGFGIYRTKADAVQSQVGQGLYVVVEPKGRVCVWNGEEEIGPRNVGALDFSLGKEFTVRVVSFGDAISVSIDNQPIYFYRDARFDREAGYISIHGGLIPLTVRDVRIQELGDSMAFLDGTETIQQLNGQVKLAIELYTKESQVLEMLPDSVDVYDTAGKIWSVPVSWSAESYDRKQTGYHTFSGVFGKLPNGLLNVFNIQPQAQVFIQPVVDKSDLQELIAKGRSLVKSDYTPESWEQMIIKLEAAEAIDNDPFLVQNDIGVAVWQLYDAIEGLVRIDVDKAELDALISECKGLAEDDYTPVTWQIFAEKLNAAESVFASGLNGQETLDNAMNALMQAKNDLLTKKQKQAFAEAVAEAKAMDVSEYMQAGRDAWLRAVYLAEKLAASDQLTASQMLEMQEQLQLCKDALTVSADTGALQSAVAKAKQIRKEDYSSFSFANLQKEIQRAESLIARGNVSEAEASAQLHLLQAAESSLVSVTDFAAERNGSQTALWVTGAVLLVFGAAGVVTVICFKNKLKK